MSFDLMPKLNVKKFRPDAIIPKYQTDGSVGLDLHAAHDFMLRRGAAPMVIPVGIGISLPHGFEAQVRPRSSLSRKGIYVALGTVDRDYRGEIGVTIAALANSEHPPWDLVKFKAGERIAQLVIAPVARFDPEEVPELDETVRGAKGYGSTGKF